jgi:hypothetical protein
MASFLPKGSAALRIALGQSPSGTCDWKLVSEKLKEGSSLGEIPRLYPRLELPKDDNC